jgi:hypothetical protein
LILNLFDKKYFISKLKRNKLYEARKSFKNLRKFANDVVADRLKEIEANGLVNNDILSAVISRSSTHIN